MKILITGASGMVGSEAIRQTLLDKDITQVTAIVRKSLNVQHPKLKVIIHKDFTNFTDLYNLFKEQLILNMNQIKR